MLWFPSLRLREKLDKGFEELTNLGLILSQWGSVHSMMSSDVFQVYDSVITCVMQQNSQVY